MLAGLLTDVPVTIDRDDARHAAAAELAKPEYHAAEPNLFQRALSWVGQRLADLFAALSSLVPGGPLGLLVLLAVVVLVVVVVRLRVGRLARDRRSRTPVFTERRQSAREHRLRAEQALAAGELTEAVRERFRAVVRDLEERGVLDELSGRTADEAARDAGARVPAARDGLIAAAAVFDAVHYGGRSATIDDYRRLTALDEQVQRERVPT